ncbi:XrtN system VIT domain-containing protein [Emticicia soli]|uniref:XrtN system VIT domain-containing protein n=1 Tax=Emticicia soli TaxID=2027878 RepID=A0ABW5JAZ1_9BACT
METIKEQNYRQVAPAKGKSAWHWHDFAPSLEYFWGLLILFVSVSIFITSKNTDALSVAFITQVFAIGYTIILFVTKRMRVFWRQQPEDSLAYRLLLWQIWIVSCFTLNREMRIFQESTDWLSVALVISCLSNILFYWEPKFPKRVKEILYIFLAASTVLWTYFAIYLFPVYPGSIILIAALGLGFHTFVPLFLLIAHIKLLRRAWHSHNNAIFFGTLTPVAFIIFFVIQWNVTQNKIEETYQKSFTAETDEVPNWVVVSQKIENNWISERILKTGLVYQNNDNLLNIMPERRSFEQTQYDPLVILASSFNSKLAVDTDDRIKILEVMHDVRHESQERLWAGDYLTTQSVITQARIYPEYRMAYTEKTLTIANTSINSWRGQEAIYTFYLPEGAVASSLSLWINGKEEKGYLTTKAKADSAYKTIVGVESRDPSVVHWQEGNRLSIRVFPCTFNEARRVKIGITSPLKEHKGELVYENIYFKGPNANDAKETIKIDFSESVNDLSGPWSINSYPIEKQTNYKPYWYLSFKAPELSKKAFSFQGKSYVLSSLAIQKQVFNPAKIYLDINAEWTKAEFDKIYTTFKHKELWVWKDGLIRLNVYNKDKLFYELKDYQFSLFPLYRIHTNSLLITKGTSKAPNLKDLAGSGFAAATKNINTAQGPIQVLSLNETLSPYLKTLKELSVIAVNKADIVEISKGPLYKILPSPTQKSVNIENAGIQINETSATIEKTDAPDHLLRLYAYNHIMKQIGVNYFKADYLSDTLVQEAATANIVTPISSLVVLEKQADYERFDIKKSQDSLGNASLKSSGSVPEPHEWLLIITFTCVVLYFIMKRL